MPPVDHPLLARAACARRSASSSSRTRCSRSRWRSPGFTVGEAEGLRRAMSRKRSHDALEAYRERFVEGALAKGVDERDGGPRLRQARRLLRLRLPEVARGRVRAARVPVGVAAPPLPGRVPLRAAERAADGLLPAGDARARRAAARGRDAAARRERQRGEVRASRTARCASGSSTSAASARTTRRRSSRSGSAAGRSRASATSRSGRSSSERRARDASSPRAPATASAAAPRAALAARARAALAARSRARAARSGSSRSRSTRRPRRPSYREPTVVGADARRLPDDEPLGRRPSARAAAPAPAGGDARRARAAQTQPHGARVAVAGMAVARQRPATANGVVFMLLEDEHGQVNLIVPPHGLRALPRARPRRAAAPRARPLRARRPQPERARARARDARRRSRAQVVGRAQTSTGRCRARTTSGTASSVATRRRCCIGASPRRSRLNAVFTSATCVNACGKLPSRRPSMRVVLLREQADVVARARAAARRARRASSSRPCSARLSASQNDAREEDALAGRQAVDCAVVRRAA